MSCHTGRQCPVTTVALPCFPALSPSCTDFAAAGEQRLISLQCRATIGAVSNPQNRNRVLGKAGANRWRGRRPKVGTACWQPHKAAAAPCHLCDVLLAIMLPLQSKAHTHNQCCQEPAAQQHCHKQQHVRGPNPCHAVSCRAGAWCCHELCGPPHGRRHCRWPAQLLPLGPQLKGQEDSQEAQGQQQVDPAATHQARLGCHTPHHTPPVQWLVAAAAACGSTGAVTSGPCNDATSAASWRRVVGVAVTNRAQLG